MISAGHPPLDKDALAYLGVGGAMAHQLGFHGQRGEQQVLGCYPPVIELPRLPLCLLEGPLRVGVQG
jgi:hypothetical protein